MRVLRGLPPAATLALRGPCGPFLSPNEDDFVGRIAAELEQFALRGQQRRVLLFPPLSSRLRYLIHRTVEDADTLSSFSVGEGWRRRTVICHSAIRLPEEASEQNARAARPPRPPPARGWGGRAPGLRAGAEGPGDASRACVGSGRIRRPPRRKPDKALYVPKAMRRRAERGQGPRGDVCPEALAEPGEREGSAEADAAALGKEQDLGEAGEEPVLEESGAGNAERPACCVDASLPTSSTDLQGQEGPHRDCSEALDSGHDESPSGAEEEPKSCDKALELEGGETAGQPQAADQGSGAGTKDISPSRGRGSCTDITAAEPAAALLALKAQDKSCADAEIPASGENLAALEEQSQDPSASVSELCRSPSAQGAQGRDSPRVTKREQTLGAQEPSAPDAAHDEEPSTANTQSQVDAPMGRTGSEREEADEERSGLADMLWHELRVSADDNAEESPAGREQEDGFEDDCTVELLEEIAAHLTVKDISVEKISFDYCSYGDAQLSESDFSHVVEIYDFSPALKTENLMEIFSDFQESGFKIQWVDDTHALGIFCSVTAACQALGRRYPSLKIRPLIHGTRQSKIKALQRPKLLQLAKERPQTDTAVARRLVTRALGLKHRQQHGLGGPEPEPELENTGQEEVPAAGEL
ncbi:R3H and coiled-coil domain-containing protein 1-like [Nothoprocta perdicaria]|uniref:R3H and coiled-coil domain-containing protein 1-like n=1 Tax=Nothoprocta perdicaria TaxID=30464 RepID=UPI000E1B699D|nr:R3H and coiled-coil domain-containing protein 1-like [Nothoprocta perdicaria]